MSNFKSSRSYSSAGGDGTASRNQLPKATVNSTFKRGQKIPLKVQPSKPVSISYTSRSDKDIINDQFEKAESHERSIRGGRDRVYFYLKIFKFCVMAAMIFGGASFVINWTPLGGGVVPQGIMAMSVIIFCVGPLVAWTLDHYLEQGVFFGASKLIAWGVILMVIAEEMAAIRGSRDPVFADWLMITVAPWSLGAIVAALVVLGYLRSDLRRKRNLMHMRQKEDDTIAKNATKTRMMKAKNESRQMTMQSVGTFLTHKFIVTLSGPVLLIQSIVRATLVIWNESWAATDIEAASGKKKRASNRKK